MDPGLIFLMCNTWIIKEPKCAECTAELLDVEPDAREAYCPLCDKVVKINRDLFDELANSG